MRKTLANGSIIEVLPTGSRVTLSTGEAVYGEPHDTESYRQTARDLGYGDDVLSMAKDHDPLHAWLAAALGLPDSPALRSAIGLEPASEVTAAEEQAVMAIQRFCRLAGGRLPL
ncbi:MAG: hypothetical protein AB7H90_01380 [Alphaproteobacteria bacterium]